MKKFTATTKIRLSDFTDCTYPQGSFVFSTLLRAGDIKVNGVRTRTDIMLSAGDEVTYYTTLAQEDKPSHKIIYEDENLLVADKYGGVSSEGLFYELSPCFPVHRLDRNTCGLIVIAKTQAVQIKLINCFKNRAVQKEYLCFAKNCFKKREDTLTAYLKKDSKTSLVRIYAAPNQETVKIITQYKVLQEFGDYALVQVILHTGKTHQIRAHLSYIGCPILGDGKYGDKALNKKYGATRQILVAKSLTFNLTGSLAYLNSVPLVSAFSPQLPK